MKWVIFGKMITQVEVKILKDFFATLFWSAFILDNILRISSLFKAENDLIISIFFDVMFKSYMKGNSKNDGLSVKNS